MAVLNNGVLDGVRRIGAKFRDVTIDGGGTGAALGYRLRGATQSGAPASGTWKAGDQVPDRTGKIWICTASGTPGTWVQAGGPYQPYQFLPETYGAKGDGKTVTDGAMSSSSNQTHLACATSTPFAATDVGKQVIVMGAGAAGVPLVTTISAFTDSGHVVLAASAGSTVSGAAVLFGTDDTAAIKTTVATALTYAEANSNYAEVVFRAATYWCTSNPTAGAGAKCNAQIPIDQVADAAQKVILVLKGTRRQSALYHWLQTVPESSGTTLLSTYAGGTIPTAGNEPAVIGGPNPHNGYGESSGLFSNMHIVIDGIGVSVPQNPEVAGFDLRGIGEATVVSASALARSQSTGSPARPDSNSGLWAWGLYMPQSNNNDICDIDEYSCEGFPVGLWVEEHLSANSVRAINCYTGVLVSPNSGFPHGNWFGFISVENCFNTFAFGSGATAKANVGCLDIEWDASTGGPIIDITSGTNAFGTINICANGSSGASLSSAMSTGINAVTNPVTGSLRIVNTDMATGHWGSAPAVPASGTAQLNTAWRDASIVVHTGIGVTVSAISIDGTSTGLTMAASSSLALPVVTPGGTVTLTYAGGTPTWDWWLS